MRCTNCTAGELTGLAFETSDLCDGPVDGELTENGELIVSFQGMCHAVMAARVMTNHYNPTHLSLRPAIDTQVAVIDLTETPVDLPRSA